MTAFYNEIDPTAAEWLRRLIKADLIPKGIVDERSIVEIQPHELDQYTQCHFFAGIGVWPLALRANGWPDTQPIWTGSCPCQPFSQAGKRAGTADERHLWPAYHWLIDQCRPAIVLGEQVASKDGLAWLDGVSTDLEGSGYAFAASDLCAAGVTVPLDESQSGEWLRRAVHDHPDEKWLRDFADWAFANLGEGPNHIRQRLYFVGLAGPTVCRQQHESCDRSLQLLVEAVGGTQPRPKLGGHSTSAGGLANINETRREGRLHRGSDSGREAVDGHTGRGGADHPSGPDYIGRKAFDWIGCQDGKWRAIESGLEPLANGVAGRVGQLSAYGNALDTQTATRFVEVVAELTREHQASAIAS